MLNGGVLRALLVLINLKLVFYLLYKSIILQLKNPYYKELPSFRNDCKASSGISMGFIYPIQQSTIYLPKAFDGNTNDLVLKVAHSKPELELYWFIDNLYVAGPKDIHDLAIIPKQRKHIITVIDEIGNEIKHKITISD